MYTILGAGLSGLSIADHLSRKQIPFKLYEAKNHGGGHIYSENVDGFTWDEGPHVSFTKYNYVRDYFALNCGNEFLDYPVKPANYFEGNWINHPAQANMYAVPEPLRTECIADVVEARNTTPGNYIPENYKEWSEYAFGKRFAETFPNVYTKKYWTTEPDNLTTDWIGKRIYFPEISDMIESAKGPLLKQTHYINTIRYPKTGGFYSYIKNVEKSIPINYHKELKSISFLNRELSFADGSKEGYKKLISTLPLSKFIANSDAPDEIKSEARKLKCSKLLLINIIADHAPAVDHQWIYVYDKEYYSTRINFTDLLSPGNGVKGKCGIQVEVYFSDYHPLTTSIAEIETQVMKELIEMGLILSAQKIESYHHKWINWANVIFDNERKEAQDKIFSWLEKFGLSRESDDLDPMTEWNDKPTLALGDMILAGRFAQWKYYWTDDCVMRAKFISENI